LIHEVNIVEAVAIDVGDRHGAAMVIMPHPHVLSDVVDRVIDERDAAFLELVSEMELVEHVELIHGLKLRLLARGKGVSARIFLGIARRVRRVG